MSILILVLEAAAKGKRIFEATSGWNISQHLLRHKTMRFGESEEGREDAGEKSRGKRITFAEDVEHPKEEGIQEPQGEHKEEPSDEVAIAVEVEQEVEQKEEEPHEESPEIQIVTAIEEFVSRTPSPSSSVSLSGISYVFSLNFARCCFARFF